jgi:TRAP-type mannitol/chloroaromatic compound transport system substrate-binding protein
VQSKGFVPVMQENGMLIAYATAEGELASDVGDGAGPYAKVLADEIVKPGVEAVAMFRRVQVRVRSSIGQEPWLGFSALGEVHFAGVQPEATKSGPLVSGSSANEAERAWALAKDSTSLGVLEAFIARYKDTFYADLARARMDDLKRQQLAAAASPKVSATPKVAEPAVATTPSASPPPPMAAQPFTLASPITLKLQDTFPANDPSSRDHLNTVLRDLTTLSGGTLKVDLLPAGTVVPGFQVLEAVAKGTLDAGWTVPSYWLGRGKAFGILAGTVPGGLDAAAFVRWMEGEGTVELNRLVSKVTGGTVRSLPCAVLGPGGEWFKKPIARVEDLKGLKFRSVGLPAEVGKEIGLIVNVLPGGEIVSALDRGLLDGSDWSTPQSAISLGLPDVAKFLYFPGWSRPTHLFEVVINAATWSKLGNDGQRGFESVCRQNLRRSLAMIPDLERQALAELRNRGVTVLPYPQAVLTNVRQAGQKILDAVASEDANFARVLASYNKYR